MPQQAVGDDAASFVPNATVPPTYFDQRHPPRQALEQEKMDCDVLTVVGNYEIGARTTTDAPQAFSPPANTTSPTSPVKPNGPFQSILPQVDGPQDYRPRMVPSAMSHAVAPTREASTNPQHQLPRTAYRDLLPYCTTETPLNEQQVVGLSDVAGSLKEVMLLALRARTDERYARQLASAVGAEAMCGIVDFFENEYEI